MCYKLVIFSSFSIIFSQNPTIIIINSMNKSTQIWPMKQKWLFHLPSSTDFDNCQEVAANWDVSIFCQLFESSYSLARKLARKGNCYAASRAEIHVIRNAAHQNRTKRHHGTPADLSMPQAHKSELDRLRRCQRSLFHWSERLSSPQSTISLHVNVFMHAATAGMHVAKHVRAPNVKTCV